MFTFVIALMSACSKENVNTTHNSTNQVKIGTVTFDNSDVKTLADIKEQFLSINKNSSLKSGWWQKFVNWCIAHSGTHLFENCNQPNDCGPCSGICFALYATNSITTDTIISPTDYANGKGIFGLSQINDTTAVITFSTKDRFVIDDVFYVTQNTELGTSIASAFGKQSFIIQKGVYPLIYDYDKRGQTIIKISLR
jgi:hypothetical protein